MLHTETTTGTTFWEVILKGFCLVRKKVKQVNVNVRG